MRVLLDECVPRRLKNDLLEHEVRTVAEMGWSGTKDRELIQLAEQNFDALITVDRNLEHQQNLCSVELVIVVIVAASNDINVLRKLMPKVCAALSESKTGSVIRLE